MNNARQFDLETLYTLLPAIYRMRDKQANKPIKGLLAVIAEQVGVVEEDLAQLYDDQFIETCAEWVIPYIGDLLGVHTLHTVESTAAYNLRAYVANTMAYRRRKGTATVLEQLALDVTGWRARAVEFFQLLATNQHLNHVRPDNLSTVDLRDLDSLDLLGGPFERNARTVEVRRISGTRGKYNIPNIGVFLWRLQAYPMVNVPARKSASGLYHFSSLGCDIPLFHQPETESEISHMAEEINVPGPIRPLALHADLLGYLDEYSGAVAADQPQHSRYYGPDRSLAVYTIDENGQRRLVPPSEIVSQDLGDWHRPGAGTVAIDVRRGRLTFAAGEEPHEVEVTYNYGFSAGMGGGPYDRRRTLADPRQATLVIAVAKDIGVHTLQQALLRWRNHGRPNCIIQIQDNGIYGGNVDITLPDSELVFSIGLDFKDDLDNGIVSSDMRSEFQSKGGITLSQNASIEKKADRWLLIDADNQRTCSISEIDDKLEVRGEGWLVIEAADGKRPSLRTVGIMSLRGPSGASLTLNGLLVEGAAQIEGDLNLTITHCTFVPGRLLSEDGTALNPDRDSLCALTADNQPAVDISYSIMGSIRLPSNARQLLIRDSIIDALPVQGVAQPAIAATDAGDTPGPSTTIERTTIFGAVYVKEIMASEVIFTSGIRTQRQQEGCIRFSYVPEGSQTPRLFHCQPALALARYAQKLGKKSENDLTGDERTSIQVRLQPAFTSERYSRPGYAQLSMNTDEEIRTGAEDGSEMGAFSHLKQPQREANLKAALDEYLRFGLEAGIFYIT